MHDLPLITTIAAAFFAAWILGLATHRVGLSPIVGYLLAGIVIGPYTPGFVGDINLAQQLAEVGVILLMFGVGLHFHLSDLYAVKWIAIPGAVGQSLVAVVAAVAVFSAFGLPFTSALVLGMAMAVASTVVLIRVLQDNHKLDTPAGHAAVGWLIVEDIFTVIALVLLPVLAAQSATESAAAAEGPSFFSALLWALTKLGVLVALVAFAGSRFVPAIMVRVAKLRSRELFTLTVLVLSIAVASGAYTLFGASMALGAFLGGMVVGQSPVSHQAASDALPLRDAFAVLFFVSVGMIFDPSAIINHPFLVIAALGITLIAKPLAAIAIVAALGHSFHTGLVVALGLAQVGEFSFILSDLARKEGLMSEVGHSVLVATAILSISLNPMMFRLRRSIERTAKSTPWLWRLVNGRAEKRIQAQNRATLEQLAAQRHTLTQRTAIVIGYGSVGQAVTRLLRKAEIRVVVLETNMDTVIELNDNPDEGVIGVFGDAASSAVLEQAGVAEAEYLLITMAKSSSPLPIIVAARELNPEMRILVRTRFLNEREMLAAAGASVIVIEEAEVAITMGRMVVQALGLSEGPLEEAVDEIREADPTATLM